MTTPPLFDYAALTPTDETLREYVFDMIPGEPSIWCAPATDENKKYHNERLRIQINDAEAASKGKAKSSKLDVGDMIRAQDKSINTDKILIARACAKKWGVPPTATDSTQPEFSEANCLAFLKALPDYMFHPFNRYIGNIYNFVDRQPVDGDDLGKRLAERLTWELRYQRDGFSVESAITKNARLKPENRRPLPQWYLDEPADVPGCGFFYEAFRDLCTERVDDGPIPWSKAMAYAAHKELDPDVADALWTVVRMMDTTERKWRADNLT